MKKILLIDAHSLLHRCYHAVPDLTAPDGTPSGALYGAANILLRILQEEKPEYCAAAFDLPTATFRKQAFEDYKAHRPKTPDALSVQLKEAPNLFAALGIPIFSKEGFEGDDVIATLAEKFSYQIPVEILTGDLDTLQMVADGRITVRTFRKGIRDTFTYGRADVLERYGLEPEQLRDYKALVGDVSDNVPGVPGIGDKGASALLRKYGSLEGVLAAQDDPRVKLVQQHEKLARECQRLVTLRRDVPLGDLGLEDLRCVFQPDVAERYFIRFGFESLIARLKGGSLSGAQKKQQKKEGPVVRNPVGGLFALAQQVGDAPQHDSMRTDVLLVSRGGNMEDGRRKVGFYLKEAIKEARRRGIALKPPYFDIGVAFWLIDPDVKEYSPEFLCPIFLKEEWAGSSTQELRLYARAMELLNQSGGSSVMDNIEMPVLPVLAEMEMAGIRVDVARLRNAEAEITLKISRLEEEIYRLAGREFNINSPAQVGVVLFDELHLPVRGKRSTAYEKLLPLKERHPIISLILEYRETFKALTTYVRPLQDKIDADGRIHTEFLQTATATGRLSSRNPNLQNISKGAPYADEIRAAFVASPGKKLLSLDYSQLELRILAVVSKDPGLTAAFAKGRDVHTATAAAVFKVEDSRVTPQERRVAKALNFGLAYGMGANAFALSAGISRKEAERFIQSYFLAFPRVRQWQEEVRQAARATGYVETLSGRRRYLPGITSSSPFLVAESERQAINHPIQGLGADIIKLAMSRCAKEFSARNQWGRGVQLLLSIHDELLFEVDEDIIDDAEALARRCMEEVGQQFSVPLITDSRQGYSWGELG